MQMTPEMEAEIFSFGRKQSLESPELTGIVMTYLEKRDINSTPMAGAVTIKGAKKNLHFWLDLDDGRRIDLRLGSSLPWLFRPEEYPDIVYEGQKIRFGLMTDEIFNRLTQTDV